MKSRVRRLLTAVGLNGRQIDLVGIEAGPDLAGSGVIDPADTVAEIGWRGGVDAKDPRHAIQGIARHGCEVRTERILSACADISILVSILQELREYVVLNQIRSGAVVVGAVALDGER